jgi:hypothetical protein
MFILVSNHVDSQYKLLEITQKSHNLVALGVTHKGEFRAKLGQ